MTQPITKEGQDNMTCGFLFQLGRVVVTTGVLDAFTTSSFYLAQCLGRHRLGDWGCVCAEDAESNTQAVRDGDRILSAYPIDPKRPCKGFGENCLWIITEADRSVTTLLLPDEY
jgi:hypothetical protein